MRCLILAGRCLILAAVLAVVVAFSGGATAAADPARAGLVVAHGDGRMAYVVVTFDGESISGAELLNRSGLTVTEVSFGGLGVGVCAIDDTGCDVGECRQRLCHGPRTDDPYWQYFLRSADGAWQVAALGVSADSIADGAVRALIWSAGAPDFAAPAIEELAGKAGDTMKNGVALTRYQADGSIDDDSGSEDTQVPYAGVVIVVAAVALAGGVVVRKRAGVRT